MRAIGIIATAFAAVAAWFSFELLESQRAWAQSDAPSIVVPEDNPQPNPWFTDDAPHVQTFFGVGLASSDELDAAFGTRTYSMSACENGYMSINRRVQVQTERAENYGYKRIFDALLVEAANYAYQACSLPFTDFTGAPTTGVHYEITSVDVYLADGTKLISTSKLCCDVGTQRNYGYYRWHNVVDVAGQARQEQTNAVAVQARNAQDTSRRAEENATGWAWARIIGVLILLLILFFNREGIARWYYFHFDPHPAEPMVQHALSSGTVLDGRALANALSEVPVESSILAKVRLEQGARLVAQMQEMSRARIREFERRAMKDYERAALLSIQEAIALAAVALEKAKALFRASEGVGR